MKVLVTLISFFIFLLTDIFVGACFSFSSGNLCREARYDYQTPFLFFGEEQDISQRAHTHGWKFYSPNENICWTTFDRSYRPTFWENPIADDLAALSRLRIWYRLGMIPLEKILKVP